MQTKVDKTIKELEKKGEVIPATRDYIFKALLQDKEMKGILSYIISEVVGIDYDYVYNHLRFRNSEMPKHNIEEKANRHDLLVEIGNNVISLEMNNENGLDTNFRNSAHFHSLIVDSIKEADTYKDMRMVVQICFDNKRPFSRELISEMMLVDVLTGMVDEENYKKYRINLSKARKKEYNKDKLTRLEQILLIMQEKNKEKLYRFALEDKEIGKMAEKIEKMSKNRKYVSLYDEEKLYKLSLSIAEHEMKKEATRKGLEEGIKEGIKEGKIEAARKMLEKKMDVDDIVEITGFTKEEILNLKNK